MLIVEDERRLARNIARMLEADASCAVDLSADGEDGLHMALSSPYDLIVLDLMLPKLDGLEVLRRLRVAGNATPVLILTARGAPDEIVRGLDLGGDDYLTKPFRMAELAARCRALIRRSYNRASPLLKAGDLEIDTARRVARAAGREHRLTAMEYRLLEYLAMRAGEVVSQEDILEHLYGAEAERFSNVVEVYISSLRKRFGPDVIRTLRGQGYVLGGQVP